jgi:hypothetical protein
MERAASSVVKTMFFKLYILANNISSIELENLIDIGLED